MRKMRAKWAEFGGCRASFHWTERRWMKGGRDGREGVRERESCVEGGKEEGREGGREG